MPMRERRELRPRARASAWYRLFPLFGGHHPSPKHERGLAWLSSLALRVSIVRALRPTLENFFKKFSFWVGFSHIPLTTIGTSRIPGRLQADSSFLLADS